MSSPVRIVDVSYVAAPENAAVPPGAIKLNAMEAQWLMFPRLQHLIFFEGHHLPPFDAVVQSLRSSLAATLATFAPLAGKLVHLADNGDVAIRRSTSDEGVRFVVAESDADVRRLAGDEEHDVETLEQLAPELDAAELPAPLLAVQATRLEGGGVALGVTMHHAVADGRSLWRFVEAWAASFRGDTPPLPPPCFDRSRVKLPGGEELARRVLRTYTPNLPVVTSPLIPREDRSPASFTGWTFTLDAHHIARLKQRIVRLGEAHASPPSSFVAVVVLAWTCFVRCRSVPSDSDDAFLFFFADVRDRLDPPAGGDYFGTCLSRCFTKLPARELHGERALAAAAAAAQGAIREVTEDPIAGWEFMRGIAGGGGGSVSMDRFLHVSGSSGFRAYEAGDFGWGRPSRTVPARMNPNGQVAVVRARDGEGVQVSVSMPRRDQEFRSLFLELLSDE